MMYEPVDEIDLEKLKGELSFIKYDTQICLQGVNADQDPNVGVGVLGGKNSWERKQNHDLSTFDFRVPLFDTPYLNEIMSRYNLFHTRLMLVKPKTCYSHHRDRNKRIHIPLVTNEDCFFILDKQVVHLPADGTVYLVDTTKMHTFLNAGAEDRVHVVGQISPEDERIFD